MNTTTRHLRQSRPHSPPNRLLGEQALGSVSGSLPQGPVVAFQTKASVSRRIISLPVYVVAGTASTSLIAGLYKDNNARLGARLAPGTLNSPESESWDTVLSPATAVTAGTKYWTAILTTNGLLKFYYEVVAEQPPEPRKRTSLTEFAERLIHRCPQYQWPAVWEWGRDTSPQC